MGDPIDDFEALREGLELELAEYEEMVPRAVARLNRLRTVLRVPVPDTQVVHSSEVDSWIETQTDDPVVIDLYKFIRDNPGVGRPGINANLTKKSVTTKRLDNAIQKLSRAKLIKNDGGNRISSWYVTAGGKI